MNKILKVSLFIVLVFSLFLVIGCKKDNKDDFVKVSNITISGKSEMVVGEEQQLQLEILPDNASNKKVIWSVSNGKYASVDENGLLKALSKGIVFVYCESIDDSSVYGELKVTITSDESIKVSNIVIDGRTTMAVGASQTLDVEVFPKDATDKTVAFSSSDESIATVNNEGLVEAKKIGTVTITVKANDLGGFSKDFRIEVVENIDATDINFKYLDNMKAGDEQKITFVLVPATATSTVSFKSNDENVLTVNDNGLVNALAIGDATITITVNSTTPFTKTFKIKVTEDLLSIDDIKELISNTYSMYANSNIGSSKMTITNGDKVSTLLYKYSFSNDFKEVNKIEYYITGDVINSMYVRDGIIYMNEAGNTGKYPMDSSEVSAFVKNYNFDKFFNNGTQYKNDASFFNNLLLSGYEDYTDKNNCTYIYELDLTKYDGTTLNLINIDKVELVVILNKGEIVSFNYRAYEGEVVKSIEVEFLGLVCDINYPSDLDTYPDME